MEYTHRLDGDEASPVLRGGGGVVAFRTCSHPAADRPTVTEPEIRQLEEELQATLLQRTKRRVQLTEAGRVFLEEAREILAHADRAAVTARRAELGGGARLSLGYDYWMDPSFIVAAIKGFHKSHPAISFDMRSIAAPLQIAALRHEHLNVGFVRPPISDPSVESEVVSAEPFVVALPKNHPLASKPRVPVSALVDQPFILIPREAIPIFYDLAIRLCRDAGFVPHVRDEVDHPESVLRLVAAGVGISFVPESVRKTARPGVAFRSLQPSPGNLQTVVAWRRDARSPLIDGFLQVVREVITHERRSAEPSATVRGHIRRA